LPFAGLDVVGVVQPEGDAPRGPSCAADGVQAFQQDALADAGRRAGDHFGCAANPVDALRASEILRLAREYDVTRVVTAYPPVGFAADAFAAARADLAGSGVVLETVMRGWDARAWPHATRGFFPFRQQIPALLRDAGLGA
jgi:deoxyribodipyrimidine photo-lyase